MRQRWDCPLYVSRPCADIEVQITVDAWPQGGEYEICEPCILQVRDCRGRLRLEREMTPDAIEAKFPVDWAGWEQDMRDELEPLERHPSRWEV